ESYDTNIIPLVYPKNRRGSVESDTTKTLPFEDQQQDFQNYLKGGGDDNNNKSNTNTIVGDIINSNGLFGGRSSAKRTPSVESIEVENSDSPSPFKYHNLNLNHLQ
ncbi:17674_t:CDS:1, partial [Dentiscutata erythropus]